MRQVNCLVPLVVRLRGLPDDERLAETREAIARTVAGRLAEASRVIAAREGWHSWYKSYAAPEFRFSGASPGDEMQRRLVAAIEAGIARAMTAGAVTVPQALPFVPAKYHPPPKKATAVPWRVRIKAKFHITPGKLFDIGEPSRHRSLPDEAYLRELYFPLLDSRRLATAWVVEALQEYEEFALADEVFQSFAATRPSSEFVYSVFGWGKLRGDLTQADQDGVVARKIPDFGLRGFSEVRPGPAEGERRLVLRPGAWLLLVFLPLPIIHLEEFVEIKELYTTDIEVREATGLVDPGLFAAELGMKWAEVERGAPNSTIRVDVEPFVVRRKVHERTLAALFERRRRERWDWRLGRIVLLADHGLEGLPPALQAFLQTLPDDGAHPRHRGVKGGFWLPGTRGASLALVFEPDLADQVLLGLNASFLAAEAAEVERILGLANTFWNASRNQALGAFIDRWRDRDPRLFALLLDELKRRGVLDAFLNAVRDLSSLDAYRRRTVIALAAKTRYAQHPGILALVHQQEALVRSLEAFRYDVDAQEVWIDGDQAKRMRAAGDSSDDKVGVVAEVEPYYSESSRIHQPRPEVLDRLSEPTRKKVGEFMARTICGSGETMTREQLLQKAIQEAAKELVPPLEEKDFVKVTMRRSIRVLKFERRPEAGYTETYVHFQEVRKIGDQPWEPSGELQIGSAIAFEARLRYYHVEHVMAALTVFFLAQTVLYGGVLIIEVGIATLGQLIFFVAIQVVIYRFTTDAEDRTLEGYLFAALKGELDAVGFKLISGFVKGAGQLFATKLISSKLVSEVATKWIVFTLRGGLTAVGVGGLEVTSQFAEDLLRYSHCQGWSSPEKYWDRFKTGFLMTLAFEFVAVPFLAPPLRLALEKAGTVTKAAKALFASGKSQQEITTALLKGSEEVEAALGRAIDPAAGAPIARSFRQRVWDVIKALGREYESRAYRSLLELYGPELGPEAARGLRRLLTVASEGEIDRLLQRLLEQRASVSDLFRALGGVDEAILADLVKTRQLAQLGTSRRLLALLTRDPAVGSKLLRGPFECSAGNLERYLGHLEELPLDARESVVRALLQDRPLPPDLLLTAARQVGALDEPTLALLRQLQEARIRVGALFDGSGPSLKAFADEFAKLSEAERAFALQLAAGRSPAQVLAQAAKTRAEQAAGEAVPAGKVTEPGAAAPKGTAAKPSRTLDDIKQDLQTKGIAPEDISSFRGEAKRVSAALAERVARLAEHFSPSEVKQLGEYFSKNKIALTEDLVDALIQKVPQGKMGEYVRHLEIAEVHGAVTKSRGWPGEEPTLEKTTTVHPGKPPRVREIVETPGSEVLRANLIKRLGEEPPPGYHAHHIIPEKQFGPGLDWMRKRLGKDIHDADNGVFLAGRGGLGRVAGPTANPELTRLHNSYIHAGPRKEYAYTLTRRLSNLHGEQFVKEVRKIGEEMSNGTFKINEIPRGWKSKWEPGMTAPIEPGFKPGWIEE